MSLASKPDIVNQPSPSSILKLYEGVKGYLPSPTTDELRDIDRLLLEARDDAIESALPRGRPLMLLALPSIPSEESKIENWCDDDELLLCSPPAPSSTCGMAHGPKDVSFAISGARQSKGEPTALLEGAGIVGSSSIQRETGPLDRKISESVMAKASQ